MAGCRYECVDHLWERMIACAGGAVQRPQRLRPRPGIALLLQLGETADVHPGVRRVEGETCRSMFLVGDELVHADHDALVRVQLPLNLQVIVVHHLFDRARSEEHTSELQSLMRISYAVFCLKKKKPKNINYIYNYKRD